ncbi:unnamed protein product [Rhizophagus irregularis]|nr:unnamed protein product [Rhizophagus irregularis]CAB4477757.1 unnamed protein product [Rhizophagus irregularis]
MATSRSYRRIPRALNPTNLNQRSRQLQQQNLNLIRRIRSRPISRRLHVQNINMIISLPQQQSNFPHVDSFFNGISFP